MSRGREWKSKEGCKEEERNSWNFTKEKWEMRRGERKDGGQWDAENEEKRSKYKRKKKKKGRQRDILINVFFSWFTSLERAEFIF